MTEELQHRRSILLSQVEAKADRERKSIKRALESHKTLQDKLKSASTSGHSAASLLQETQEDVEADRIGVTFTEANMQQLLSTIRSAGQVRLVTFTPTQRPSRVPEDHFYNAVTFSPDHFPVVADADMKLLTEGKDIISPLLQFDRNTLSDDIQLSSGVVSNIQSDPAPEETGCRQQSRRHALTLRPLTVRRGQTAVFCCRVSYSIKQLIEEGNMLWETALTRSPVDANCSQATGLSVRVVTCPTHKQKLCLWVQYDNKPLTHVPLTLNQVGVSHDLHLCIMLDRDTNKIHVVDVSDVKVFTTTEASLDRPLWVLMHVGSLSNTDMTSQLISERDLTLSPEMKQLLSSLI